MNSDLLTATRYGFNIESSLFIASIVLMQQDSDVRITLAYAEKEGDYRVETFTAKGDFLLPSGAGYLNGELEFVTLGKHHPWEHEALKIGDTYIYKANANGHPSSFYPLRGIVFEDPYLFSILLTHLKRCEYRSGVSCRPFGMK